MDYADNDTTNLSTLVSPRIWNYGTGGLRPHPHPERKLDLGCPRAAASCPTPGLHVLTKAVLDGWQISGIMTLISGAPQGVSLVTQFGQREQLVRLADRCRAAQPDRRPHAAEGSAHASITTSTPPRSDFPPQGTLGNAAKYVFRGPGRNNFDISLFKNFRMAETFQAQFRAESYNTFNHTQFSALDLTAKFDNVTTSSTYGAMTSPTFGNLTGATGAPDATRVPRDVLKFAHPGAERWLAFSSRLSRSA